MTELEICVVVVNYYSSKPLAALVDGLASQAQVSLRVVLVDNSGDLDARLVASAEEGLGRRPVVIRPGNVGYGWGNNLGLIEAMRRWNPRFALVCNPDIQLPQRTALARLALALDEDGPKAVCAGPSVVTGRGITQNPYMERDYSDAELRGEFVKYVSPFSSGLYFGTKCLRYAILPRTVLPQCRDDSEGSDRRVFALHGSCILLDAKRLGGLRLLPPFDERVFLFGEENVLARRIALAGGHMLYAPSVRVIHHEDSSPRPGNSRAAAIWTFRKHFASKRHLLKEYYA